MGQKTLQSYLDARFPLIWVRTHEEHRVIAALKHYKYTSAIGPTAITTVGWTITQGLHVIANPSQPPKAGVTTPQAALVHLGTTKSSIIGVLPDFHAFLNEPTVVRGLREVVETFRTGNIAPRTVIIISPLSNIPPELEKYVAILDYDLPDQGMMESMLMSNAMSITDDYSSALLGLTSIEAEKAIRLYQATGRDSPRFLSEEKKQIVRKGGILEFLECDGSIDRIGGLETLKEWIRKRGRAFSPEAHSYGLPRPRGILLLGIPGCGKSETAKVIGNTWGFPCLKLDFAAIFHGIVGSSEENMRKVLKMAESLAPCILFIDEIEKGLAGGGGDGGTSTRVLGTFLTWLQECPKPVFVVATANDVSGLPPELLRAGRFDKIFFVDLPTQREREAILSIHIRAVGRDPDKFAISYLASCMDGFSGGEVRQVVRDAMFEAFDRSIEVGSSHIEGTIQGTVPLSSTMGERIERLREWCKTRATPATPQE